MDTIPKKGKRYRLQSRPWDSSYLDIIEDDEEDYAIALQQAIEYHCKGEKVPAEIALRCPYHTKILDDTRTPDTRINPMNPVTTIKKIRACESEVAAQLLLEAYAKMRNDGKDNQV